MLHLPCFFLNVGFSFYLFKCVTCTFILYHNPGWGAGHGQEFRAPCSMQDGRAAGLIVPCRAMGLAET